MRRVLLACCLSVAALALACAPEALDTGDDEGRRNPGGDGGGGSGGTGDGGGGGAGGGATGGSGGGGGGGGGAAIPCDDPADDCNGGVCPFGAVDCSAAGERHAALCAAGCQWFPPGMNGCAAAADMAASCAEAANVSPTNNAMWTCTLTAADCAGYTTCLGEACR